MARTPRNPAPSMRWSPASRPGGSMQSCSYSSRSFGSSEPYRLLKSKWGDAKGDSRDGLPKPDNRLKCLSFFEDVETEHDQPCHETPEGRANAGKHDAGSGDREADGRGHAVALVLQRDRKSVDER